MEREVYCEYINVAYEYSNPEQKFKYWGKTFARYLKEQKAIRSEGLCYNCRRILKAWELDKDLVSL